MLIGLTRSACTIAGVEPHVVTLGPLSADDVARLVGGSPVAADLSRMSAGHPLTVAHIAQQIRRHASGTTVLTADLADLAVGGGGLLGVAVDAAVRDLPSPDVVHVLAASRSALSLEFLSAATDESMEATASALLELLASGLVIERPDGTTAIANDLVREAIRSRWSSSRRVAVERMVERGGEHSPLLLDGTRISPGQRHLQMLFEAAQAAHAQAAFDEALRIAELALEIGVAAPVAMRQDIAAAAGAAAWAVDDADRADHWYRESWRLAAQRGDEVGVAVGGRRPPRPLERGGRSVTAGDDRPGSSAGAGARAGRAGRDCSRVPCRCTSVPIPRPGRGHRRR